MDYHFVPVHMFEELILNHRYSSLLSFLMSMVHNIHCCLTTILCSLLVLCCLLLLLRFIEYGCYRGHYYGTSLDSVNREMAEGKVCLLDIHPSVSINRDRQKLFFGE